jgi:hypothetical protein
MVRLIGQALIHDGYRCVVTGKYDWNSVETIRELGERFGPDPNVDTTFTHCAHIFAESTNSSIEPGSAKAFPFFFHFYKSQQ